jgi:1-pyrroline-5-carboxylate dehydrogenase
MRHSWITSLEVPSGACAYSLRTDLLLNSLTVCFVMDVCSAALAASLEKMKKLCPDIPVIIGGKEYRTGNVKQQVRAWILLGVACLRPSAAERSTHAAPHHSIIRVAQLNPSNHKHVVATYHGVTQELAKQAITNAMENRAKWASMPWNDRAAIFLKACARLR